MVGRGLVCAFAVAALTLSACSGDNDASADAPKTTTTAAPAATTTTAPAATTTTTIPPPYSFDGSVPPPPLANTGTDYEAIYRSLDAYSTWLVGHNPDVALLPNFAVPGANAYQSLENDMTVLANDNRRYYSERALESVEVIDQLGTAVSLRVVYAAGTRFVVNADGSIHDENDAPSVTSIAVLAADQNGRWRVDSYQLDAEPGVTEL